MKDFQLLAAIYAGNTASLTVKRERHPGSCIELCRQYCLKQNYRIVEEHIYQSSNDPLWSNAPQFIHLRTGAIRRQFDILIVPTLESIDLLIPWQSLKTSQLIDGFYTHRIRVETVVARHNTHDVYKQMLLEAIHVIQHPNSLL